MSALILYGVEADHPLFAPVAEAVKGGLPEPARLAWFDLPAMTFDYCNGSGFCRNNSPGICCKRDQMQEICPHLARASQIVFVSQVRFGGFGGHMKKAIDRFSPHGLGTYVRYNGELHHEMRYSAPAAVVNIGIMRSENEAEEQTFHLAGTRIATCLFAQ